MTEYEAHLPHDPFNAVATAEGDPGMTHAVVLMAYNPAAIVPFRIDSMFMNRESASVAALNKESTRAAALVLELKPQTS